MPTAALGGVTTIDGQYCYAGRAAAYLVQDGDEAAFVDNVTRFSVRYLLEALEGRGLAPEQVRYLIVTHIHLDHCGGTAELAKHCPRATVLCHPRAAKHIVDPARLVESAKPIYGEEAFKDLYGVIEPVAADRVQSLEDGARVALGSRTFTFLDAPGHARHHFVIQDSGANSIFAGDAFGLYYAALQRGARPFFMYVCAPPQFDPAAAKATVERIRRTGVDRVFVTHFGCAEAVEAGAEQMTAALDLFDCAVDDAAATDLEGEALLAYCSDRALGITVDGLRECGLDPEDAEIMKWAQSEHAITSQGLKVLAEQRRNSVS